MINFWRVANGTWAFVFMAPDHCCCRVRMIEEKPGRELSYRPGRGSATKRSAG